jgi:hypothetical protein
MRRRPGRALFVGPLHASVGPDHVSVAVVGVRPQFDLFCRPWPSPYAALMVRTRRLQASLSTRGGYLAELADDGQEIRKVITLYGPEAFA